MSAISFVNVINGISEYTPSVACWEAPPEDIGLSGCGFRLDTNTVWLVHSSHANRGEINRRPLPCSTSSWAIYLALDPERAADDSRPQTLISRFISTTLSHTAAHTKLLTACKHAKKKDK